MFIFPFPKSPHHDGGRIGPVTMQDWYVNLRYAIELHRHYRQSKLLILTAFAQGGVSEAEIYINTLRHAGIERSDLEVVDEGFETIGQVAAAESIAKEKGRALVIVSTLLHFPRIRYYAKSETVVRTDPLGIPRLSEIPRDILMMLGAPLFDISGWRDRFAELVIKRRRNGIL